MIAEIDPASGFSALKSAKIDDKVFNSEDILKGGDESADFEKCAKLSLFKNRSFKSVFGDDIKSEIMKVTGQSENAVSAS